MTRALRGVVPPCVCESPPALTVCLPALPSSLPSRPCLPTLPPHSSSPPDRPACRPRQTVNTGKANTFAFATFRKFRVITASQSYHYH